MALRVHTNLLALDARHQLERSGRRYAGHLERIASGLRIVRAADDPQGLARSSRADARLRSTAIALRNVDDAIGMVRTVTAALVRMTELGSRLRQLALQASSGTTAQEDLLLLDQERLGLARELTRIASTTRFNGVDLLGRQVTIPFQVGVEAEDVLGFDLIDFRPVGAVFAYYSLLDEELGREKVLEYSGVLVDTLAGFLGFLGSLEARLGSVRRGLQGSEESLARELGALRDADFALEAAGLERERLRVGIGALVLAQANVSPSVAQDLLDAASELGQELRGDDQERRESRQGRAASALDDERPRSRPGSRLDARG